MLRITARSFGLALISVLAACTLASSGRLESSTSRQAGELLTRSTPAHGQILRRSPGELSLTFREPVRLAEVTISGDDQLIPIMLAPAGAQKRFRIPLPELDRGSYTVAWRAGVGAESRQGSFRFQIR